MKHSHPRNETMKAVQWEGKPFSVSINSVPIPKITNSRDAIIRITSSGICGSDLHVYHGRLPAKPPMTIGHEIVGIVHSIGEDVDRVKVGDRVIVSAIIDEDTLEGAEVPEGLLGIGDIGGFEQFNGGQTSFVRVPFATENLLLLPSGKELELEYVMLADIFPTSNWALDCAGFQFGDVVVVFGAGPVGLLCAYSAFLRGASKVYSVDRVPQRLAKAKSIGAIPIDFSKSDPVAQILKLEPQGVDRSCDCVGFECVNAEGVNVGNLVYSQAINITRVGGGIGLIGGYLPDDPGAAISNARKGIFEIPVGTSWIKSQTIRGGIVPLRQYQQTLKKLIDSGRAKPSFVVDREVKIEEVAKAYQQFSDHDFIKAVIRLDDSQNRHLIEEGESEEKAPSQKKRKRNGA